MNFDKETEPFAGEIIGEIKLIDYHLKPLYEILKRCLDIILSIIGIILAIPIIIFVSFAIILESKGPVVYWQYRTGKDGKVFRIYKLRSMYYDAEATGIQWACVNDERVTKVGKILRRTRIDEIPQFINILKGEMSMVGPRPERPYFMKIICENDPDYVNRLIVKPGLTGWAQICGGYNLTPPEKLVKDLYYIRHRSLWLDLLIIIKTVNVLITGHGAR